jgi:hypothetical protein
MRAAPALLLSLAAFGAPLAAAQDRLNTIGELDMRWVSAAGDLSWLNGGPGLLRFDPQHEGLRLGHAMLDSHLRLTDTLSAHVVGYAYDDHDRNFADLSEAYLEARPFPTNSIRWNAKLGAFHMPISLENRGPGWTDVYTITPSALNTWLGEEFRTIGAELEARWLGASRGYLGDLAVVGAVYGWNDPAGSLLADRGFGLSDRTSTLFGGLGKPPLSFYHEVDDKPGYYGGLTWRHHDRLELRVLRYDNRADPGASTSTAYAWRTRFSSLGLRLEPDAAWTFIVQFLDGNTAVGADDAGARQFQMTYSTAFALASLEWRGERFTARFDDFRTNQFSGLFGPPSDQVGHAWTLGWQHEFSAGWQLAAEWIRVTSRFPPTVEYGEPPGLFESQLQLSVRYRFHWRV